MISSIEDGNTASNIPQLLMKYYSENKKVFPAQVYFIKEKMYVLCSRLDELPAESQVTTINNEAVSEIRKRLLHYLPSDGIIETKKTQILNNGAFPILYNWIYEDKNSFAVTYKTKQGYTVTTTISAALVKNVQCNKESEPNTKPLQLDFPEANIALFTIKTFDDNRLGAGQNFKLLLDTTFKEIDSRKISRLIIDLRGNGGGADAYGALLHSYLTDKPFRYFHSIESTRYKITPEENSLLGIQEPQKNSFTGKVFFLVNGESFSTTADFCATAKSNNRGTFVGEETGGGYYGNTSGQTKKVELSNSKINVTIPKFKYVNAVKPSKYKDRGIIPEYVILPTVQELIQNKDVQLGFTLKLAR